MLSPQFLDELRARTTLSALVGKTVKLQRAGREWKAPCPFHKEKTASFYVNDEKGFAHCFGCSVHMDAIRWLTDTRGLTFIEAVKELASAAGMEVPAPSPEAQQRGDRAGLLYEVMSAAAAWYREQLEGLAGAEALAYLDRRGITPEARKAFGLGYAPRSGLKAALSMFEDAKLVEAGLIVQPDEAERGPYDRFRDRITFPIRDARGRCIAFAGRALGDAQPKYLNSPDTPLFDKGRTLFNIDRAAAAARQTGRLIVVEGQMDVIGLWLAGIEEVTAPGGTALTEWQIQRLWRVTDRPLLCFDGDAAGTKAASRAAVKGLEHVEPGRTLYFVQLPEGQDPDELAKAGGREAVETVLEQAEPLVDRIWRDERHALPLRTPEDRAGFRQRLGDRVASIKHLEVRRQYHEEFRRRLAGDRTAPAQPQRRMQLPPMPDPPAVRAVIAVLLRHRELLAYHAEEISGLPILHPELAQLRDRMLMAVMTGESIAADEHADLVQHLLADRLAARLVAQTDLDALGKLVSAVALCTRLSLELDKVTGRLQCGVTEADFRQQQLLRNELQQARATLELLVAPA